MNPELLLVCSTAFLAGVLGSGHCLGMCGGIAGSLGAMQVPSNRSRHVAAALQFNLGRLLSYGALGLLAGSLLGAGAQWVDLAGAGYVLRLATAVLVALIGLHFLTGWHFLAWLERGGARVWKHVMPWSVRFSGISGGAGRWLVGLTWGLLPCGLVYTMLLTAASTGRGFSGALVMFCFGLGTLPSMLGLTLLAPGLSTALRDVSLRRIIGLSLLLLAAWMAFSVTQSIHGSHHSHAANGWQTEHTAGVRRRTTAMALTAGPKTMDNTGCPITRLARQV